MTNPQGTPIWYELMTSDLAAATPFYHAVLGWSIAANPDPLAGEMDYRMIERTGGGFAGGAMALDPGMISAGMKPCWQIYFGVDDVDATVAKVESLGGAVHMPATTMDGVGRMAMLADPQGAMFYIMRGESDESSDVFSITDAGYCRWNELSTSDAPDAMDFYKAVLGFKHNGGMPMGEAGEYAFIAVGETTIGAISPMMPPGALPAWLPYFGVASTSATKSMIEANGGSVLMGPHQVPGGDWIIVAHDPQGAMFGIVGPK